MQSIYRPMRTLLVLLALSTFASITLAQAPGPTPTPSTNVGLGAAYPATSEVSDQKAGSILVYNFYSSSATSPNLENTRINLTNISQSNSVAVHLFFIDGTSCTPADAFVCLTPNGTVTFVTSDVDPGVRGYIIAVASDKDTGCPINFNFLIGDEYIKLASGSGLGQQANLGAEAFSALFGTPGSVLPGCDASSNTVTLSFDGTTAGYNKLPRTLALDHFQSQLDNNQTCLIINRIGGNLTLSASIVGPIFAIFYDDAEQPFSVNFSGGTCQLKVFLNSLRTLGGGINSIVPQGRSGWIRFYPVFEVATNGSGDTQGGVLGAALNFNPDAAQGISNYTGGHNLHKLTLTAGAQTLIIPVFPPFC